MKEESIYHVKVNYNEAVQSKKDLLSSERDFLRILKIIKKYDLLRREELTNKLRMQNKLKDLKSNITKLHDILPKIKLPDILKKTKEIAEKKEEQEEKMIKVDIVAKEPTDEDELEAQLRDIQERLKKLG